MYTHNTTSLSVLLSADLLTFGLIKAHTAVIFTMFEYFFEYYMLVIIRITRYSEMMY